MPTLENKQYCAELDEYSVVIVLKEATKDKENNKSSGHSDNTRTLSLYFQHSPLIEQPVT
jgi:hypothetical protein